MDPEAVWTRRRFLIRSAKAAGALALACAGAAWFYEDSPPPGSTQEFGEVLTLDFSVPGLNPRMSIVRGADRKAALRTAVKATGGIQTFVQKGDQVLLKVNAAFASPPLLSATTHPDLVSEMTGLCLQAGARSVTVTDIPINDPASCFALTGIEQAVRSAGGDVVLPQASYFALVTMPKGRLIRGWPFLRQPLDHITRVIALAPVKDHHRSGASMIMKNWYGLLGGRRNIFHQDIHTIIKELAMLIKPTLVVLDGTTTMMRNGPTGGSLSDLKKTHTMIVSTDQVAADAFGATLLEKSLSDLPFITQAEEAGVGSADYRSLNPVMTSI